MRPTLLLLFVVSFALFSCTSEESTSDEHTNLIHPPEWIQGTWYGESEDLKYDGFRFTENDIIIFQDGLEISQNLLIDGYINAGFSVQIEQDESEDWYSIHLKYPLEADVIYSFERKSENSIVLIQEDASYNR